MRSKEMNSVDFELMKSLKNREEQVEILEYTVKTHAWRFKSPRDAFSTSKPGQAHSKQVLSCRKLLPFLPDQKMRSE